MAKPPVQKEQGVYERQAGHNRSSFHDICHPHFVPRDTFPLAARMVY